MSSCFKSQARVARVASIMLLLAGSAGCHMMVNPFTDELAGISPATTPSAEVARASGTTPTDFKRPYKPIGLFAYSGAVTHGPLYFEDGFEDAACGCGHYEWCGEDYLQLFYWRGRFALNAVMFPVSVVVTPPHVTMVSDGRISRELMGIGHDSERWIECPAAATKAAD